MKHLVTGGSGFVGNLVARRLLERGEQVRILDVWADPSRPAEIEYVECSVTDRDRVRDAMQGVDVVHHNAALVAQTAAGKRYFEVNVEGSRVVTEEAAKAGVQALIHTSSTSIFGAPDKMPITNDTPTLPFEPYGRSKLEGEHVVDEICARHGIPLITIRPRATLGAGRLGIFQVLFEWIRDNRNVYVIGSGDIGFQFIHAADLMDLYMTALDLGRSGTYNVGTDEFGTLRGDLEKLIAYAGSTSKVVSLPVWPAVNALRVLYYMGLSPLVPWHYMTYHKACYFDVQPLLDLGWKPRYSNDAMLRESYDWFVANRDQQRGPSSASPHRAPLRQQVLRLVKRFS
jgi:nucleoside-diphosphate-sugar epimerase